VRSLTGLSTRGVRRRPGRFALTGAGIALGVAVLFAVLITSTATTAALDDAISGSAGEVDVAVTPAGSYDATIPPSVVDHLRDLDGVDTAIGQVTLRSSVVPEPGQPAASTRERITFVVGTDLVAGAAIRRFDLESGAMPASGREVVLGRRSADELQLEVGDEVGLATPTGTHRVVVAGILGRSGAGLAFQGGVAYAPLATTRQMLGKGDVLTGIDVVLDDDVDTEDWIAAHRAQVPDGVFLQDADTLASDFRQFLVAISGGLMLMAAIAMFVGGFLVFLTFTIAVAERTRTYGTLRALGAHPRQVRRVVLGEAIVLGLAGSAVGLGLGRLLGGVGVGAIEALLDLDLGGLGFPLGAALLGLALGVGVSVVAAWLPGRRASAVSPTIAIREGAAAVEVRGRWWLRALLLAIGLVSGALGEGFGRRSISTVLVLLGAVLLVPFVLQPVARVVGRVTQRLAGGTGSIAVMHLVKERSRSAYTLGLVMIVLAMLIAVAGTNAAMANTLDSIIDRQTGGAVQVGSPNAFDPSVEQTLASIEGTGRLTPVRFGQSERVEQERSGDGTVARETRDRVEIAVVDAPSFFRVAGFSWADGDDASAEAALTRGGAVLLPDATSASGGYERGDTVLLETSEGLVPFEVAGTYAVVGPGFGFTVGAPDAARFGAGRPNVFLVDPEDGVDPEALADDIEAALRYGGYDPIVDSPESTRDWAFGQLQGFFGLAYVILVVAAMAGLLGLANTLAVSVLSRTREIGMLRSVGTTRKQIRRLVLVEAITLALVAFVLAVPLGFLINLGSAAAFKGAIGASIEATQPWGALPLLLVLTLGVAALASILPARRAGRLEPVAALRFD
jgi:putative ABC transport system permease protein